jgi:hypothetical protein
MLTKEVYLQVARQRFYDIFTSENVLITEEDTTLLDLEIAVALKIVEANYPPKHYYTVSQGAYRATDDDIFLSEQHLAQTFIAYSKDYPREIYVAWIHTWTGEKYDEGQPLFMCLNGKFFYKQVANDS